jgi:hypothetical protein
MMKKYQLPPDSKCKRNLFSVSNVGLYGSAFQPYVKGKEPRFIKLADDTPNPHGNIAPPNTPTNRGKK